MGADLDQWFNDIASSMKYIGKYKFHESLAHPGSWWIQAPDILQPLGYVFIHGNKYGVTPESLIKQQVISPIPPLKLGMVHILDTKLEAAEFLHAYRKFD